MTAPDYGLSLGPLYIEYRQNRFLADMFISILKEEIKKENIQICNELSERLDGPELINKITSYIHKYRVENVDVQTALKKEMQNSNISSGDIMAFLRTCKKEEE